MVTAAITKQIILFKNIGKVVDEMKSVIKGASYILAHTPDMVLHNGTTQTTERIVNPESEYLKELPNHLRPWRQRRRPWPG